MDYLVPALGAIGIILTAYAAVRKASEDSAAGAAVRWKELVDTLQEETESSRARIEILEADNKKMHDRTRELEAKERAANERLLHLENDHGDLARQHKRLKGQLARLEKRVEYYKRGVSLLVSQIVENGMEPAWRPQDDEQEEGGE